MESMNKIFKTKQVPKQVKEAGASEDPSGTVEEFVKQIHRIRSEIDTTMNRMDGLADDMKRKTSHVAASARGFSSDDVFGGASTASSRIPAQIQSLANAMKDVLDEMSDIEKKLSGQEPKTTEFNPQLDMSSVK
jgi:uncharacterized protein YoxC